MKKARTSRSGALRRWLNYFLYRISGTSAGLSQSELRAVQLSGVFDADFYLTAYPDLHAAGADPLLLYLSHGRFEKRKASATFDPAAYLEANPEVAKSGIEPFLHYVLIGRAAGAPRSPAEIICRRAGLDYEHTASQVGLSQGQFEAVLLSGVFDADFYSGAYPDIFAAGENPLLHYLKRGRFEKRKASATFDPTAYLEANPEVATSGIEPFLHYVMVGRAAGAPRSPAEIICRRVGLDYELTASQIGLSQSEFDAVLSSDVFDANFYLNAYPDVRATRATPLLHYLRHGRFEKRKASATFDPVAYLEVNPEVASSGIEPFLHYVLVGRAAGAPRSQLDVFCRKINLAPDRFDELEQLGLSLDDLRAAAEDDAFFANARKVDASGLFDKDFYRTQAPSLDQRCEPLFHYMIWGYRCYLDPSPKFSSAEYCLLNPDVPERRLNPLLHYVTIGLRERRILNRAERDERNGRLYSVPVNVKPAEEHAFLERARGAGYLCRYGFSLENSSSLQYATQAIDDLAIWKSDLTIENDSPELSIIIPCYGQLQLLLNCLDSLAAQKSVHAAEVIVVDDDSPPETQLAKIATIPWVRYLKVPVNGGFIASCNYGAARARGQYLVFLNSDTRVVQDWLDELVSFFKQNPKTGLVGSKLLNNDGTLQEAGGIIWRDGTGANYGRGDSPWRPEYCFARQVDYCSGASIAVSSDAWKAVGGFDTYYAPAYYEDVDLAFQLRRAGYQTWLQPLSLVIHYEGGTHGREVTSGIKAYQTVNWTKFYQRWRDVLRPHGPPGHYAPSEVDRVTKQRVLIIDSQMITPDRDAGSVITYELIKLFLHGGWHVSFAPRNFHFIGDYTQALQRMGVEVLIEPCIRSVDDIFNTRGAYDVIAACRSENFWDCFERARAAYPTARVIFFDIDLVHVRLQRKAELLSDRQLRIEAEVWQDRELDLFANVDCSVVVTEAERQIVQRALPLDNIVVYPYTIQVRRSQRTYDKRLHLCFVGSYAHDPNVDAVLFFIKEIWPLVRPQLPPEAKFFVIGGDPPEAISGFASDDIVVTGFVPQLNELMDSCRLSVVPLRYGAGIKGKLILSLAEGLPAVATPIAVEGMGLVDEINVLVADNMEKFAAQILRLYRDIELWQRLQNAGYSFVEDNYSWQASLDTFERILDTADRTWLARRRAARAKRLADLIADHRAT